MAFTNPSVAQKKDAEVCHGTDHQLHNNLITVVYNIKENRFIYFFCSKNKLEFKRLRLVSVCLVLCLKIIFRILFTESAFNNEFMI